MIESVNSVVQSTPLTQANAQGAAIQATAQKAQEAPREIVRAPFISPVVAVNVEYDTAVLEIRNRATGDVVEQIPSDPRLEAQLREQARREASSEKAIQDISPSQATSAQAFVQDVRAATGSVDSSAPQSGGVSQTAVQQVTAFENAARSGNSNAGSISLFA